MVLEGAARTVKAEVNRILKERDNRGRKRGIDYGVLAVI